MRECKPTIIEQAHQTPRTCTAMHCETSHLSSENEETRPLNGIARSSIQTPVMLVRRFPNSAQGKLYKRQNPENAIKP